MMIFPTGPRFDLPDTLNPVSVAAPFSSITGIGGIPIVNPPTELKGSNAIDYPKNVLLYYLSIMVTLFL
jgi:hypothetical protein